MKQLAAALLGTVAAAIAAPALAADMPVKARPPVVQAAYNWSGFYLGVHAGYGWGELTSANDTTIDHEPKGGLFGGQVGWNYQVNQIVFGIEGDLAYSTIDGSDTTTFGPFTINGDHETKYLGTVRGRIGLAHDRILAYVTGGWAWAKVEGRLDVVGVVRGTDTVNISGWTVGGGIEFALADKWSARIEYLHVDFRPEETTMNLGFPFRDEVDKNLNVIRVGINYRM